VLGRVVEVVTGAPLVKFFEARIFTALKMADTSFLVPNEKVVRLAQPFATDPVTGNSTPLLDLTVPQQNDAGGMGTAGTAADYARFSQMLLNGGQLEGALLLGRATVAHTAADHLGNIRIAGTLPRGYGFGARRLCCSHRDGPQPRDGLGRRVSLGRWSGHGILGGPERADDRGADDASRPWSLKGEDRDLFRQLVLAAIVDRRPGQRPRSEGVNEAEGCGMILERPSSTRYVPVTAPLDGVIATGGPKFRRRRRLRR
jgi:hypothetical protein